MGNEPIQTKNIPVVILAWLLIDNQCKPFSLKDKQPLIDHVESKTGVHLSIEQLLAQLKELNNFIAVVVNPFAESYNEADCFVNTAIKFDSSANS